MTSGQGKTVELTPDGTLVIRGTRDTLEITAQDRKELGYNTEEQIWKLRDLYVSNPHEAQKFIDYFKSEQRRLIADSDRPSEAFPGQRLIGKHTIFVSPK